MSLHQFDLFAAPVVLPGFALVEEFVSPEEQTVLTAHIDAAGLTPFQFQGWEGKRLTASYGYAYEFDRGRVLPAPPLPDWLLPLRARIAEWAGFAPETLVQALLIRYDPGAAIGWHRDRPQFGEIFGLSLGSQVPLRLRRRVEGRFERKAVPLPPRSLYRLNGEARAGWEHSIAPHEATRRSITFRTLA